MYTSIDQICIEVFEKNMTYRDNKPIIRKEILWSME